MLKSFCLSLEAWAFASESVYCLSLIHIYVRYPIRMTVEKRHLKEGTEDEYETVKEDDLYDVKKWADTEFMKQGLSLIHISMLRSIPFRNTPIRSQKPKPRDSSKTISALNI